MATFINTLRGLLNLDHVVLIKQGVGKEAGENYVQLADGRIIHGILIDPIPTAPPTAVNAVLTAPATEARDQPDEELKTAVGRWQPIDERTPKHGNYVRVWAEEGLLYCPENGEATHWMPLTPPLLPQDETETAVGRWGG